MKNTFKTKWFVYLAELEEDISLEGKERKPAFRRPPPVQGFMQLFFKFWGKLWSLSNIEILNLKPTKNWLTTTLLLLLLLLYYYYSLNGFWLKKKTVNDGSA